MAGYEALCEDGKLLQIDWHDGCTGLQIRSNPPCYRL